jgi:hypothetical protein
MKSSVYYLLHSGFLLAYLSILKMEATCPSETSVDFQRNARRYIPEDINLQVMTYFILNFNGNYINFIYIVGLCVNTHARSAARRTRGLIQQKSS